MKKEKRYWFVVRREEIARLEPHDLMELLRYDSVRVECNPPEGFYLLSKLETGGYQEPSIGNWKSYGVRIYMMGVLPEPPPREGILGCVKMDDEIEASRRKNHVL